MMSSSVWTATSAQMVDPVPISLSKYVFSVFGWKITEMFPGMW
jgi:hypothetical protein